ncbi:MAG: hypothetical protein GY797_31275 [Deltaproteobacteria bacterium]|nr:hypothetical protein [Deltaproteobacteria bacterium]
MLRKAAVWGRGGRYLPPLSGHLTPNLGFLSTSVGGKLKKNKWDKKVVVKVFSLRVCRIFMVFFGKHSLMI